jgi:hypothetical protein
VLKNNGVFAASAYNLLRIEPAIDEVVNRYYHEVVGPFWPPERKLVENFPDLPFPFHEIEPPKIGMTTQWDLDHLIGCLRTWSSTQRFIAATGADRLEQIIDELRRAWENPQQMRTVIWPLTLRVGIKIISGPKGIRSKEAFRDSSNSAWNDRGRTNISREWHALYP